MKLVPTLANHGYYRLVNGIGNKSRDPIETALKANFHRSCGINTFRALIFFWQGLQRRAKRTPFSIEKDVNITKVRLVFLGRRNGGGQDYGTVVVDFKSSDGNVFM